MRDNDNLIATRTYDVVTPSGPTVLTVGIWAPRRVRFDQRVAWVCTWSVRDEVGGERRSEIGADSLQALLAALARSKACLGEFRVRLGANLALRGGAEQSALPIAEAAQTFFGSLAERVGNAREELYLIQQQIESLHDEAGKSRQEFLEARQGQSRELEERREREVNAINAELAELESQRKAMAREQRLERDAWNKEKLRQKAALEAFARDENFALLEEGAALRSEVMRQTEQLETVRKALEDSAVAFQSLRERIAVLQDEIEQLEAIRQARVEEAKHLEKRIAELRSLEGALEGPRLDVISCNECGEPNRATRRLCVECRQPVHGQA